MADEPGSPWEVASCLLAKLGGLPPASFASPEVERVSSSRKKKPFLLTPTNGKPLPWCVANDFWGQLAGSSMLFDALCKVASIHGRMQTHSQQKLELRGFLETHECRVSHTRHVVVAAESRPN